MQKITNIEIKNFKSIRHTEIKDCRRVNVFIGYPNVGKSNILEALSLFSVGKENTDLSNFVRLENLTTLFYNGDISKQAEIEINERNRMVAKFVNNTIQFEEQIETDKVSFKEKDLGKVLADNSINILHAKQFSISSENYNVTNLTSPYIGNMYSVESFKKYTFTTKIASKSSEDNALYFPYGSNIFSIISTNKEIKKEVEELFQPYNLELLYDSREQKFTILKRTATGIFTIPYDLIADTLQRVIFYKAAIQSNKEAVLLFEEPEAHMFPPYIAKFTADVNYDKNNNQFFIATHSPFVLNDFMEDLDKEELAIYAVGYKKETGETVVRRITDDEVTGIYQYGIDLFFNLENFLKDAV